MSIRIRSYEGEPDLQPIADLFNACEAVDRLGFGVSVPGLRQQLPPVNRRRDLCLWEDSSGVLVGFAGIQSVRPSKEGLEGWLEFRIHPEQRTGDLGAQVISWGMARAREVGQEPGVRVKLNTQAREDEAYRKALLEKGGFTISGYMLLMALRMDESLPEPVLPEGFSLHPSAGEGEAEAWVAMYNEAFIDARRPQMWGLGDYKRMLAAPFYRPEMDMVAVSPEGTLAAFCLCRMAMPGESSHTGGRGGWVSLLGTRRGFRGMGLGRAMLLAGLHRLRAAGVETALLGVDADNPTGAGRLYESVGFHKLLTWVQYEREV